MRARNEEGEPEICKHCEEISVFLEIIKKNIDKLSLCKLAYLLDARLAWWISLHKTMLCKRIRAWKSNFGWKSFLSYIKAPTEKLYCHGSSHWSNLYNTLIFFFSCWTRLMWFYLFYWCSKMIVNLFCNHEMFRFQFSVVLGRQCLVITLTFSKGKKC